VPESDAYLLGRGESEEARLERQIAELAPDSDAQLDKVKGGGGEDGWGPFLKPSLLATDRPLHQA